MPFLVLIYLFNMAGATAQLKKMKPIMYVKLLEIIDRWFASHVSAILIHPVNVDGLTNM